MGGDPPNPRQGGTDKHIWVLLVVLDRCLPGRIDYLRALSEFELPPMMSQP